MKRAWLTGLPFDGVCEDCRAALPRGTTWHECGKQTRVNRWWNIVREVLPP